MKLSRTALAGLALAIVALVLAVVILTRPGSDQNDAAGDPKGVGAKSGSSSSGAPSVLPGKIQRPAAVDNRPLAARELELLWARGRAQELLVELDRVSANKDPEYWREVGPLLVQQAAKEGRPEVATYLLATGDAAPNPIRAEIYAAALDNRDERTQSTARLELENMTGEEFTSGDAARAWIAAHPRELAEEFEEPEDQ